MRVGFLAACVVLLAAVSCWDQEQPCKSSSECAAGDICVGPGAGPYYCRKDCTSSGQCPVGAECKDVTSADCPVCQVITKACLVKSALLTGPSP